jgi:hypothetical protein
MCMDIGDMNALFAKGDGKDLIRRIPRSEGSSPPHAIARAVARCRGGGAAGSAAAFIGEVPFLAEVNPRMPRTYGENQLHVSQVVGWCEAETPMVELPSRPTIDLDRRIATHIANRIPNGSTLQAGIGSVPNAVLELLANHRDLGIHTEFFCDGFIDLVERGVVTGTRKRTHRNRILATTAIGSQRL